MYSGLAWAADACEMMLLSFVGPAVCPQYSKPYFKPCTLARAKVF